MARKRKKAPGRETPDDPRADGTSTEDAREDASPKTISDGSKSKSSKRRTPTEPLRERPSAGTLLSNGGGPVVAPPAAPPAMQWVLFAAATLYLSMLFLGGARSKLPAQVLPPSFLYLTQATCLFPNAAQMSIDYRIEGWDCDGRRFVELDPTPHFPIHATDKESRFQRVGHFHRRNRPVMEALERYVVGRERASGVDLGGIRVSSLRIPLPAPGDSIPRWERAPLDSYPEAQRKLWFHTPTSRRRAHCQGEDPFAAAAEQREADARGADSERGRPSRDDETERDAQDSPRPLPPIEEHAFDDELEAIFEGRADEGSDRDEARDAMDEPSAPSSQETP